MNKSTLLRFLTTIFLFLMLVAPMRAQEKTDSIFSFRFISGKNMFYVPLISNGDELNKLLDCVGRYKEMIKNHEIMVHVNGYCSSKKTKAQNLAVAKIRSNRVKSELIVRRGLTEDCFVTRNHSGDGNYVTVNFVVPKDSVTKYEMLPPPDENKAAATPVEPADTITTFDIDSPAQPLPEVEASETSEVPEAPETLPAVRTDSRFALKTNLLDYAILMPNLEFEWMIKDRWSLALEGQCAWYSKTPPHKVYRLATVIPEARYWVIDRSRWHGMYVGLFAGVTWYDLDDGKAGHKGHKGEGALAGLSVGYMWPIWKQLSLDAGLGVGYLRVRDKQYLPADGHYLYQLTKNIDYFGPLRLKLSLVWRF